MQALVTNNALKLQTQTYARMRDGLEYLNQARRSIEHAIKHGGLVDAVDALNALDARINESLAAQSSLALQIQEENSLTVDQLKIVLAQSTTW